MEKKKGVKKKVVKAISPINSDEKICVKCGCTINLKHDPYIIFSRRNFMLGHSINKTLKDVDYYFHATCWKRDLEDQVNMLLKERMKQSVAFLQDSGLNLGMFGNLINPKKN